jgi:hypothetical protein
MYERECPLQIHALIISSAGYLIHEQTLCDKSIDIGSDSVNYQNTTFNVTIPSTVGPAGRHYVLIAQTFNTDGSYYGASLNSDIFELIGANGTWSEYQLDGATLWGNQGIPCSGFACVKACAGGPSWKDQSDLAISRYEECVNACPSVSILESSTRGGQPTAALTTPSPCSINTSPSDIDATATPESTGVSAVPSASRSPSATAAAGSSAAGSGREVRSTLLIGFTIATTFFVD